MARQNVRHDTMEISLRHGRSIIAERESYCTGGPDPTVIVMWKLPDMEIQEFQGSYNAYGRDGHGDAKYDDMAIATIHQCLESAFNLMEHWLAPPEEDPMGGPGRYE